MSSSLMLRVPSLNPIRLRGVACEVDVDDVRPKPSCDHRMHRGAARQPGEVADRVEGDLRVVRAGLHAEVAAAAGRVEIVAGQRRQRRQRGGPLRREAEAVVEEARPEADRDRQIATRGRPIASPVSIGGACGLVSTGADRLALGHLRRGRGPRCPSICCTATAIGRGDVERREREPVLRRGGDAGLVRAVERHRPADAVDAAAGSVDAGDPEARVPPATAATPAAPSAPPRNRATRPPRDDRRAPNRRRMCHPLTAPAALPATQIYLAVRHLARHLRQRLLHRLHRGGELLLVGRSVSCVYSSKPDGFVVGAVRVDELCRAR